MNKEKIGKFISECRNNKNISQKALGELIKVSSSTISKWENGKSLPEVSIMPKLCTELDITVNELISGEKIDDKNYIKKAEDNLLYLKELEEKNNKVLQRLKVIIQVICIVIFIVLTLLGLIAQTDTVSKFILIGTGIVVLIIGICFSLVIKKEINNSK